MRRACFNNSYTMVGSALDCSIAMGRKLALADSLYPRGLVCCCETSQTGLGPCEQARPMLPAGLFARTRIVASKLASFNLCFPSLFLLRCSPFLFLLTFVFRDKSGSLLEGFALLHLDALQTILCSAAGFRVGHTEHVVGFHALVGATVAWNWLAEVETAPCWVDAVESCCCILGALLSWAFASALRIIELIESSHRLLNVLVVFSLHSVEFVDLALRDWLKQLQVE
jgi:hypothetical protein